MKKLMFTILISVLSALNVCAQSTPREIAQKCFPSVVLLVMEDVHGQPLALGSGFFVRANLIASNRHVVEGASGGYAKLVGQKQKYELKGILDLDERNDLVLLKIEGCDAPALEVDDSSKVAVGAAIYSIGNPKGLEGTFASGIVSGIRQFDQDSLLQITAPISPGSSGGPILNDQGNVIGVAVATFKSGQNLNFAIPANCLTKLMSQEASRTNSNLLKSFDVLKQQAVTNSIFDGLGGNSREGVEIRNFRWNNSAWDQGGGFTFTILNRLQESICNVSVMVIFYDKENEPVDFEIVKTSTSTILPSGLAKPVWGATSARQLSDQTPKEFRVLGFEISDKQSDQ